MGKKPPCPWASGSAKPPTFSLDARGWKWWGARDLDKNLLPFMLVVTIIIVITINYFYYHQLLLIYHLRINYYIRPHYWWLGDVGKAGTSVMLWSRRNGEAKRGVVSRARGPSWAVIGAGLEPRSLWLRPGASPRHHDASLKTGRDRDSRGGGSEALLFWRSRLDSMCTPDRWRSRDVPLTPESPPVLSCLLSSSSTPLFL